MSGRGARFNFPSWNYGYTLGPPTQATGGDYTQFITPVVGVPVGVVPGATPTPPARGGATEGRGSTQGKGGAPVSTPATTKPTPAAQPQAPAAKEVKTEASIPPAPTKVVPDGPKEDGEIVERPINEILHGRNPITFCNDQSKIRNLHMEWEQVSETGPPHDKTFTWSLKMGEMLTMGSGNSKKAAKNKAAEEMCKKLDQLPKLAPKRPFNQAFGGRGARGRGRGGYHPGAPYMHQMGPQMGGGYGNMPPPQFGYGGNQFPVKKPKREPSEAETKAAAEKAAAKAAEDAKKPLHPAQNNPISKLYEHTKRQKLPEPIFELVQEEVLETRKTSQGFTYKKTKYSIQCEISDKRYIGESLNKKTAKFNAAARAWADLTGLDQSQLQAMLDAARELSTKQT